MNKYYYNFDIDKINPTSFYDNQKYNIILGQGLYIYADEARTNFLTYTPVKDFRLSEVVDMSDLEKVLSAINDKKLLIDEIVKRAEEIINNPENIIKYDETLVLKKMGFQLEEIPMVDPWYKPVASSETTSNTNA